MVKLTIALVLMLFLSSCITMKNSGEFSDRWVDSKNHSAVSWWYLGESETDYYIKEKWPIKSYKYIISKSEIKIIGVDAFSPCQLCKGVNLKTRNIETK